MVVEGVGGGGAGGVAGGRGGGGTVRVGSGRYYYPTIVASQRKAMERNGNHWKSMKINGNGYEN